MCIRKLMEELKVKTLSQDLQAEFSGALQCVAVCCSVLRRESVFGRMLQCVAACCGVMQCFAVCCTVFSLLQCDTLC